ncbi:MAG: alpha/beta hydrolase [Flavobacterium sp.]|nr:alpha/beta hydrolase [Flavobacterium sp.]
MKKYFLHIIVLIFVNNVFSQNSIKVSSGKLDFLVNFESKFVTQRNVAIWLPNNYDSKKKYNVLYMHDGQMLFDASSTWNKQSWEVDETIGELLKQNKIKDVLVVGIWNSEKSRHADYFPQKPFEGLSKSQQDSIYNASRANGNSIFNDLKVQSDSYLKFLVQELKPYIDSRYAVYKDFSHTFIAGSSMGGLISMYAICEYPKIFGGAICMSTHWPGIFKVEGNPIPKAFFNYLETHLPDPKNHKFYFDYGTETLDKLYETLQPKVDLILAEKGYSSKNWITKKFEGDDHSERSWSSRFHVPIEFMLKK